MVYVFDELLHHHMRRELPWNRIFARLCSLGVHFINKGTGKIVSALQARISTTHRASLGSWNNTADIPIMTGLCIVEHSGSRWMSPSEHDIKLGAMSLLRSTETLLDLADMDDDLYNFSALSASIQSWQIRLASLVDFIQAQECGVLLAGNEGLASNIITSYRWAPPHTFRLADTKAGRINLEKFRQNLTPAVWYTNRFVCLDKYASTDLGLNQLRLRVSEAFEPKDLISTHNFSQIFRNPTTTWSYTKFLTLFLGDTRAGTAEIDVALLLRIRDFRTRAVLVGTLSTTTKTIYAAAARLERRVDVTVLDESLANPERSWLIMSDFEDPVLSNEMFFCKSGPKSSDKLVPQKEDKGKEARVPPPIAQVGGEFAVSAVGRTPLTFCTNWYCTIGSRSLQT